MTATMAEVSWRNLGEDVWWWRLLAGRQVEEREVYSNFPVVMRSSTAPW